MPQVIHDDDDRVYACPECDSSAEVWKRTHSHKTFEHDCICHKCGATFDDPVDREVKDRAKKIGRVEDADGLPSGLNEDAKELIRTKRDP